MRKASDGRTSDFLKAEDISPDGKEYEITKVQDKMMDGKYVLEFKDEDRALVLNKTNNVFVANALGEDVDSWVGAIIELIQGRVLYMGKMVPAIQVTAAGRLGENGQLAQTYTAKQSRLRK